MNSPMATTFRLILPVECESTAFVSSPIPMRVKDFSIFDFDPSFWIINDVIFSASIVDIVIGNIDRLIISNQSQNTSSPSK